MNLARVWMRQIYGASMAAVLIPGAIIGALLVLTGGSLRRISDLGQVFTGPGVPGGDGSAKTATGGKTALPAKEIARLASSSALPGISTTVAGTVVSGSRGGRVLLANSGSGTSTGASGGGVRARFGGGTGLGTAPTVPVVHGGTGTSAPTRSSAAPRWRRLWSQRRWSLPCPRRLLRRSSWSRRSRPRPPDRP